MKRFYVFFIDGGTKQVLLRTDSLEECLKLACRPLWTYHNFAIDGRKIHCYDCLMKKALF